MIFNETIDRFKKGLSIEDLLETINTTSTHSELMDRLDVAGIEFGCGGEFNFLCPLVKGIDSDYLFDTIDVPDDYINPNDESMILKAINDGIQLFLGGNPPNLAILEHDGLILSIICKIFGHTGPSFYDFDIFKTKDECMNKYIKEGWLITYSGGGISHSDEELIKFFLDHQKSLIT